ncbi:hypothetical protein ACM43_09890 [Bradyrhizobium sp. CCBAU 45321]|uniref:hypothetical protein n=1 Tax=Bradyrhizobium sp. CCBAU 45321 TaxID=1641878 RepID=UPI002304B5FE|nr:hypothetical protein [Bradyrhizobium sp. CCBAU 45321]MDA9544832.1 hypothetical protein [Bradyrhizobium sp. CCBAU 45321]
MSRTAIFFDLPNAKAAKNTYGVIAVAFYSIAIDWGLGPETGKHPRARIEHASAELSWLQMGVVVDQFQMHILAVAFRRKLVWPTRRCPAPRRFASSLSVHI